MVKSKLNIQRFADNREQFFKRVELSAKDQDHTAQYLLALSYSDGYGIPQNQVEAVKWMVASAEAGNGDAQCTLGFMFALGECGVKQDYGEAHKWLLLAADSGNKSAKQALDYLKSQEGLDIGTH